MVTSFILRKHCFHLKQQQAFNKWLRSFQKWNYTSSAATTSSSVPDVPDTSITPEDPIHRVDLRVAKIVRIDHHPDASHLFVEQVDLNAEPTENMPNPRTIVSGLAPFMPKESLHNKLVVVVSNLKPSRFRGVLSQGMLLATSTEDGKTVQLLSPPEGSLVGERVALQEVDWQGQVDAVLKPKQKVFESVVPFLKTNENGIATYKNRALITAKGPITCSIKNGQIS